MQAGDVSYCYQMTCDQTTDFFRSQNAFKPVIKVFVAVWVCLTFCDARFNPARGAHEQSTFTNEELGALVNEAYAIVHDHKKAPERMHGTLQRLKEHSHLLGVSDDALIYLLDQLKHREATTENLGHQLNMMLHYTGVLLKKLRNFSSNNSEIEEFFTQAADSIEAGNYPLAGQFLVKAEKEVRKDDQEKTPALLAEIIANQGDLKYSQLDYLLAADRFSHAASILMKAKKSQSAADFAQRAGEIYAEIGLDQKAELYFKKVLAIRESQKNLDGLKIANTLNDLALIYEQAHRLDKAEDMYQRALQILAKTGQEKSTTAQTIRNDLEDLRQRMASPPGQKLTERPSATTLSKSVPHIH